jgi:hypothetical protein
VVVYVIAKQLNCLCWFHDLFKTLRSREGWVIDRALELVCAALLELEP